MRGVSRRDSQGPAPGAAVRPLLCRMRTEARAKRLNPMVERSYRGLLWTLVLVGTTLDQASKYGVFKWLYHDGDGGQQVIVPGVFKLLAQFTDQRESPDGLLAALRAGSGPILPKVNHGALFGLGGERETLPHAVFAAIGSACGLDPATMANTVFAAVS